jgi:glycine hydroxymethyltransferase
VPYDPRKPFDPSGIRLGTAALTTRGLTPEQMPQVAAWMDETITAAVKDDEAAVASIAGEVREFLAAYPMPGYGAS